MTKSDKGVLLPLLPLRGMIVFPASVQPLEVGRKRSIAALDQAMLMDQKVLLVAQKDAEIDEPDWEDMYRVGVLARVKQLLRLPEGQIKVLVEGVSRYRVLELAQVDPYYSAFAEPIHEPAADGPDAVAAIRAALRQYHEYAKLNKRVSGVDLGQLTERMGASHVADTMLSQLPLALDEKQRLLSIADPLERLEAISIVLAKECELLALEKKIQLRVRKQMERAQREYYLREQIKAIQKELGEKDERLSELDDYRKKIEAAKMPKEAKEKALHELERLEKMPPAAAEGTVVRNYLDWLLAMPWRKRTTDRTDIVAAKKVLDADHHGLDKVKERILEFLSVRQLVKKPKAPILCLVGPPGVGKTSLARSIATSLNREFVRFSLGGVRDEAEIRGHRRTYVGAMPGRIVQSLRRAGTKNPVILLDEIDKMASDFRGDPAAGLLEALDPEQNHQFGDHYLEVPFDLSEVMFITTANDRGGIPRALWDRMEIIRVDGYTVEEKWRIARRRLVPKQLKEHGLSDKQLTVSDKALQRIIEEHTRESGVRGLERAIGAVCRKAAREILEGKERVQVSVRNLERYLGRPRYRVERAHGEARVGVAQGLAYTEYGGGLMHVEASVVKGSGKLLLTGKLGEVMRESAQTAHSYLRAKADELGIDDQWWKSRDVHIHVPEGAVPKEGPSAGITIAVALASAFSGRPVRGDVAMTGEITLRGRVLPVGGVKEKVLAAQRAGIELVLLPKENERDLEEIPKEALQGIDALLVEAMDEVLDATLLPAREAPDSFDGDEADPVFVPPAELQHEPWIEGNAS